MINPKLHYCPCGQPIRINKIHKIRMLIHGDITLTCPQCQTRLTFRLIHHTVKIHTKQNKKLKEVYKNA